MHENVVKFGRVVSEIGELTDRQTYYHNISHPSLGEVMSDADQSIVKKMDHDRVLKSTNFFAENTTQLHVTDHSNYADVQCTFLMCTVV